LIEVRTPEVIGECPTTLSTLDYAHRLLAMHANLPLHREMDDVHAQLNDRGTRLRIFDFAHRSGAEDLEAGNKIVVAILRAVANGYCTIDWTIGPLSLDTDVTVTVKRPPAMVLGCRPRHDERADRVQKPSVDEFLRQFERGRSSRRDDRGGRS
jgi:hypothetical protein